LDRCRSGAANQAFRRIETSKIEFGNLGVSREIHGLAAIAHHDECTLGIVGGGGHQPARVGVGQRKEEDAVDDAENGRVGADTQSHGEERDGGDAGGLVQHAESKAQILCQDFD
jgi:hypothetical protein